MIEKPSEGKQSFRLAFLELCQRTMEKQIAPRTGLDVYLNDENVLLFHQGNFSDNLIGGVGITSRRIDEIKAEICPNIQNIIKKTRGKIIILGNGISNLPMLPTALYLEEKLDTPPILVELFDYQDLNHDLQDILDKNLKQTNTKSFSRGLLELRIYCQTTHLITSAIQSEHLEQVIYRIGSGSPPPKLKNAELVINIHGPEHQSFREQLSLLAPAGKLLTNYPYSIPSGFSRESLCIEGNTTGQIITRRK